jgi:thymidine kinase
MTTTTVDIRERLQELTHEIAGLRSAIRRTFQDEQLLSRIGHASEVELVRIGDERSRLQDALANLLKEQSELSGEP